MQKHKGKKSTKAENENAKQNQGFEGRVQAKFSDNRTEVTAQRRVQRLMGRKAPKKQQPNNTGMPDDLKDGMESLSGMDMSDVNVHYNSDKPAQLNADAYAQDNEIHLAPGQEEHLPHEAWHTVQQKQGRVKPTTKINGANINDDAGLEKEADQMGRKAVQRKTRKDFRAEAQQNIESKSGRGSTVQRKIKTIGSKYHNNGIFSFTPFTDKYENPFLVDEDGDSFRINVVQPGIKLSSTRERKKFPAEPFKGNEKRIGRSVARGRFKKVTYGASGDEFTLAPLHTLAQLEDTPFDVKVLNAKGRPEKYDDIEKEVLVEVRAGKVQDIIDIVTEALTKRVEPIVEMAEERRNVGAFKHYKAIKKKNLKAITDTLGKKKGKWNTLDDADRRRITALIRGMFTGPAYAGSGGKKAMMKELGKRAFDDPDEDMFDLSDNDDDMKAELKKFKEPKK